MSKKQDFLRRFWQATNTFVETAVTRNIVLTQAMGICPIIAAGTTLQNGVALTACTGAVLVPLGLIMPLVGNRLPKCLRPVLYVLLAGLTLVGAAYLMETRISPELYAQLYVFIPLIAVNMLHAHGSSMTRSTHPVETVLEALGGTIGFGMVICAISVIRELMSYGSIWGHAVNTDVTLPQAATPFCAFLLLGLMSALLQWTRHRIAAYFRGKEAEHA